MRHEFDASKCNAVILAGGKGTRLQERTGGLPKPMVPVLGIPLLERQVCLLKAHGFGRIALLLSHEHEKIQEYFSDGSQWGVEITYCVEPVPRGTAGALHDAHDILADQFLVLYGDTYLDVDLTAFWQAHLASGCCATLFLHPNDHPADSDLVTIDSFSKVTGLHPYPHSPSLFARNLVNAALYALTRDDILEFPLASGIADIAKDLFPAMINCGKQMNGYVSPEYIKDMGTPERLDKVEADLLCGLPERLSSRRLRSAVFLDRDGTINSDVGHLNDPNKLKLIEGAGPAIKMLNRVGLLAVVVTNQPVIARGELTVEGLEAVHARLEMLLAESGAYLDRILFCPHHPDSGFAGEVVELKKFCACRKPGTGMIDKACSDLGIDRATSWMVGDSTIDIEAGRRAGLRTILVGTGSGGADGKVRVRPDYFFNNFYDAANWIVYGHGSVTRSLLPIACELSYRSGVFKLVSSEPASINNIVLQVITELLYGMGCGVIHDVSFDEWRFRYNAHGSISFQSEMHEESSTQLKPAESLGREYSQNVGAILISQTNSSGTTGRMDVGDVGNPSVRFLQDILVGGEKKDFRIELVMSKDI